MWTLSVHSSGGLVLMRAALNMHSNNLYSRRMPICASQRPAHGAKASIDLRLSDADYRIQRPSAAISPIDRLRRKHARQTRDDEARGNGGARGRLRFGQGIRTRHRDAAFRQRGTAAGEISAEAPDDRPDQPAAATGDAIFHLQRWPDYAEQRFFRPLSSGGCAARYRSG